MFKLLTIFLAIGLSSQSALKFTKMVGIAGDTCPAPVPTISAACNTYGTEHGTDLAQCVQKGAIDMMTKIQADQSDPEKVKKDVCDGEVVEDACLDIIKAGCTADDVDKVKTYMNACVEWAVEQATGVKVHC